ncbi:putative protelomerase [Feldmannia species virus]|uniref:Putative protelomerase n=1 Tax=Feldmannia species virus TaxID=39420 RepID=B5LWE9_9PHYC|nr:putative protelomerase [Feldmannia species virus]ACH46812.1 putative protelomerase [Feldmannia species virus]
MPSAFIRKQAELLHTLRDPLTVLQNIRDKYAVSSFPSQMTRVKDEWFKYGDRHKDFGTQWKKGYASLKSQNVSGKYLDQYREFQEDKMKEQLLKVKEAAANRLTGSKRTDAAIASIKIMPDYMAGYRLTKADIAKNKSLSTDGLEKRAMQCVDVDDADALVSQCTKILVSLEDDIHVVVAALAVVTGRRAIEILKVGEFRKSVGKGPYAMSFNGAAKRREKNSESTSQDVPLLVKFKYVKRALDLIRSRIPIGPDDSNAVINARFSHKLGDAAKIITNSVSTRFHDLRAIYGCVTHVAFENKCSINIWLKRVLLHDSIDTSVFYSRCKVSKCLLRLGDWDFKVEK